MAESPLSNIQTPTPPLSQNWSFEGAKEALMRDAQAKYASKQAEMGMLDQQAQKYGASGMSDLDRASILFQAAGAFAAPTRGGGFMESLGAAGTAVSGPLQKAAQAERDRQDKMAQLQLARTKLAGEMGTGGVSGADILALEKARLDSVRQPSEFDLLLKQLDPADRPKALRVKAGLETKKPPISDKLLLDMEKKGSALYNLDDLTERFEPDFAGKYSSTVGDAQNLVGSRGLGWHDQSRWWSDYAERKNLVRAALFGATLTKGEEAAFNKADIEIGMSPDVIKEKLARQREAARAAVYKTAKAKEAQGFDITPLEEALGFKLSDLQGLSGDKKAGAPAAGAKPDGKKGMVSEREHPQAEAAYEYALAHPEDPMSEEIIKRFRGR
jgi:hypothetical protein